MNEEGGARRARAETKDPVVSQRSLIAGSVTSCCYPQLPGQAQAQAGVNQGQVARQGGKCWPLATPPPGTPGSKGPSTSLSGPFLVC